MFLFIIPKTTSYGSKNPHDSTKCFERMRNLLRGLISIPRFGSSEQCLDISTSSSFTFSSNSQKFYGAFEVDSFLPRFSYDCHNFFCIRKMAIKDSTISMISWILEYTICQEFCDLYMNMDPVVACFSIVHQQSPIHNFFPTLAQHYVIIRQLSIFHIIFRQLN